MQQELSNYMDKTGTVIKDLVTRKQNEILQGLRERVAKAAETSQLVEDVITKSGLPVSNDAKAAITSGTEAAKENAKRIIEDRHSETASASESKDANDF
ncbi:Ff.00g067170.m01.CDS01 [Fusarium sp. VM40]|nr:Ff.00g067170.m01.CDS01 [Fusarium sp. VM40]